MSGRLTLGLYNTYDARRLHDIHRRSVARASPLCSAFDFNLALFGFPLAKSRAEAVKELRGSTTIGKGGAYIEALAETQRLNFFDFPKKGFPPQLGLVVATTSKPSAQKAVTLEEIAERVKKGESVLLLMGLGRRGLPREMLEISDFQLELTGKGIPLETCTVMGLIAGLMRCLR